MTLPSLSIAILVSSLLCSIYFKKSPFICPVSESVLFVNSSFLLVSNTQVHSSTATYLSIILFSAFGAITNKIIMHIRIDVSL